MTTTERKPVDRVALIGTGRMGAAMADQIASAGLELTVHNRTRASAEAVAERTGAAIADTAADAAGSAPVVLVMLADDAAVRAVHRADDGLVAGLRPGTVVLEMGTVAPATVRELAPAVTAAGATLLDAPVSGSVATVQQGALTVLVGGDGGALDRARPVLETFSRRVMLLGDLGAGATMKLAVNSVVHAFNQALSEALVLAEKAGVDRAAAYEVFANSAIAAPFVEYKRESFLDPEAAPVAFALDLVAKDLELIAGFAAEVDARMALTDAGRRLVAEAREAGLGDRDLSALAVLLRR